MLVLDYEEINRLISMREVMEAIETFYLQSDQREDGDVLVPDRMFVEDKNNTVLIKPSFYDKYYGAKLIGIAPGNAERGEPTLKGNFLLNDRTNMEPLGFFDARSITALRTGAISGLSMKYLAPKQAKKVGIIGTGEQGWSHLLAACAARPIEEVYVHNRSPERLQDFIETVSAQYPELRVKKSSPEEISEVSDIIIATTTATEPVIANQENMAGKHIAASGSFRPYMQEIPDDILQKADRIFVDTHASFHESKDMMQAEKLGKGKDQVQTLQELVLMGDEAYNEGELTIFKSVGESIFDIITAKLIYEKYAAANDFSN